MSSIKDARSRNRVISLIKALEKEAFSLRSEIEKIDDRRKKELLQREYAKLISKMEEIKNPTPVMLLRYE